MGLFRRIFGAKKPGSSQPSKEKRRWSFASRSSNTTLSPSNKCDTLSGPDDNLDATKHAIAVAAATAAVAEAALAAAQAAAEVVRLSSGGGRSTAPTPASGSHRRWTDEMAAVKIQSAFRGYLARRALRALKALVKLQALVRGHIVRKQTADMLRRMQTLVRLQARARATRGIVLESSHSSNHSSHSRYTVPTNPYKDHLVRAYSNKFDAPSILKRCCSNSNLRDIINLDKPKLGSNWLDHWMEENLWNNHSNPSLRNRHIDEEKSDKILEVDTWVPHMTSQQSNRSFQSSQHVLASDCNGQSYMTFDSPSKLSTKVPNPMSSISSGKVLAFNNLKLGKDKAALSLRTAENSPHVVSASSRRGGHFTPTRSEQSWRYLNGYSGYPSYMANTESFQAKVRSQSARRQSLEFDKYGSSRLSVQGLLDIDTCSERGLIQHTEFRNKAYPGSSRLNRIRGDYLR